MHLFKVASFHLDSVIKGMVKFQKLLNTFGELRMMKQLSKNAKLRNALLLSTALHLIFMVVLGMVYLQSSAEKEEPFIQVEIVSTPLKRTLRRRRRLTYTSHISTSTKQRRQQLIARSSPLVRQIPLVTSAVNPHPSNEVPLSMLNEKSLSLAMASDTVGETAFGPSDSQIQRASGISRASTPLGRNTIQKQRFLGIEKQHAPPDIPGLTQSDLALAKIARNILSTRTSDKIDIVFLIDSSQSMRNDIEAVRDHLSQMINLLQAEKLDFTVGIVAFRSSAGYGLLGWDFEVTPQTNSVATIKKVLSGIKCRGGEKALDALVRASDKVEFRKGAERRFILVTDEFVSGGYSAKEVLAKMQSEKIHVDVIGRDENFQKLIAQRTAGIWLPISSLKN